MILEYITLGLIGALCGIIAVEMIAVLIHDWRRKK